MDIFPWGLACRIYQVQPSSLTTGWQKGSWGAIFLWRTGMLAMAKVGTWTEMYPMILWILRKRRGYWLESLALLLRIMSNLGSGGNFDPRSKLSKVLWWVLTPFVLWNTVLLLGFPKYILPITSLLFQFQGISITGHYQCPSPPCFYLLHGILCSYCFQYCALQL